MYRLCPSAYSVSKARLDFPEPDTPVRITSFFLGISTVTFLRLCWRAPVMMMRSSSIGPRGPEAPHPRGEPSILLAGRGGFQALDASPSLPAPSGRAIHAETQERRGPHARLAAAIRSLALA